MTADALTHYYANPGTPPGRWLGKGVAVLGTGDVGIAEGEQVTEDQLARLLGAGRDPITADPLGRPYQTFASVSERISSRIEALPPDLNDQDHAVAVTRIEAEERQAGQKSAAAGFDKTS